LKMLEIIINMCWTWWMYSGGRWRHNHCRGLEYDWSQRWRGKRGIFLKWFWCHIHAQQLLPSYCWLRQSDD
jgi:hypothetical protein